METGVSSRGPVGTVVPVVHDPRKASRARTGPLADIDTTDGGIVLRLMWGTGLALVAVRVRPRGGGRLARGSGRTAHRSGAAAEAGGAGAPRGVPWKRGRPL
ncbi:hypothetical protein SAMN05428944_6757 [Streptomyces sp. 1222.5]|nr:hypothetical protein BX260_1339 [Streptomyces sp. 5112.2]SED18778.1 hypothetical protein SAMN05428944_6757 [Streptomyces sp. 1222.5]